MSSRTCAWSAALAVAATLLLCAWLPYRLTDGDSCLYAAMAHDMAHGGGAWLAPQWSFGAGRACFHENPPGAFWLAGLFGALGGNDVAAALLANALALWLLVAATWRLGGAVAAGVLLLHLPVLHYTLRFGLEVPFAACFTGALAAARSGGRGAFLWTGLAAGGALLTRGVFALALAPLLLADAALSEQRRRRLRRAAAALAVAALLALLFDLGHAAATGHGFWSAYLHKQVLPSLEEGGTPHPNRGSTALYYGGRLLVYGLPWLPLALVLLWRQWRQRRRGVQAGPLPRDLALAALWMALLTAGAMVARREGSRYLFAVWPASAWIAALALRPWWERRPARLRQRLAGAVLALVPILVLGKFLVTPRDAWWRSADALRAARPQLASGPIYGPFARHDDRRKQFLRYHAAQWAFPAPAAPPAGAWVLRAPGEPVPPDADVVTTDLFRLVRAP
ncbi:MAG: hypothetical protein EYC70_06510 [Planctomycetota bacterium]|nr:MAG: hypothetical protein EYC70_06510 [Planctomycetota bacterium]